MNQTQKFFCYDLSGKLCKAKSTYFVVASTKKLIIQKYEWRVELLYFNISNKKPLKTNSSATLSVFSSSIHLGQVKIIDKQPVNIPPEVAQKAMFPEHLWFGNYCDGSGELYLIPLFVCRTDDLKKYTV